MLQILFEGLVRTMREYVSEKKKYFQIVQDIEQRWEYSDQKKNELKADAEAEFSAKKEQYIKKFTNNTEQIKKAFKDKQKDFSVEPVLIENISSEFIGDTRSLNMLLNIAETNGLSNTSLDGIRKFLYSDAELDAVLEKFINALDGGTIIDYVVINLNKVAYKCNINLDYAVHDEIGHTAFVGKVMGLN